MFILRQPLRSLLLGCAATLVVSAAAQAQETGDAPPPVSKPQADRRVFTPADFTRFAPRTALDMVNQVPGFTIRGEDNNSRGVGERAPQWRTHFRQVDRPRYRPPVDPGRQRA